MPLTVDDAQLLRMATEPPRDAVRILHRSRTFAPLLVLAVLLPPVLSAVCTPFESETAIWGLKATATARADVLDEILIPGLGYREDVTLYQPPLQAWLLRSIQPLFPRGSVEGLLALSVVSVAMGTWLNVLWVRETAGPAVGLVFGAFLTFQAPWLILSCSSSFEALTVWLLAATAWGLWGHWRTSQTLVSLRLLVSGLAWGLAVLAGGPLAIAFLLIIFSWLLLFSTDGRDRSSSPQAGFRAWTLAVVAATGLAISGWWWAMMVDRFGSDFMIGWLLQTTSPFGATERALRSVWWSALLQWLQASAFIGGFCLIGFVSGLRCLWRRENSAARQLAGFMAWWLLLVIVARLITGLWPAWGVASIRTWNTAGIVPITFLAAYGVIKTTQREFSLRTMLVGLTVSVACIAGTLSHSWQFGLIFGLTCGLLLMASAPISVGLRRASLAWSEAEIRRWIQGFACLAFVGHAVWGSQLWWTVPPGRKIYENCRQRLAPLAHPDQISLVTSDLTDDPAQLEYLLLSLFPEARMSRAVGWDGALTETIVEESRHPHSRLLVVEWSRRELKLRADVGTGWQVTPIVEPVPYRSRRLAVNLIEPALKPAAAVMNGVISGRP